MAKKPAPKARTDEYCFLSVNGTPRVVKKCSAEVAAAFARENGFGTRYKMVDRK